MKDFKKFGGAIIADLGEYIREYIKEHGNSLNGIRIYVGCDSEHNGNKTRYATVVLIYHIGAGAHFIFKNESVPKVKDMYMKLWGEVERAFTLGEYLETELEGSYKRLVPNEKLVDIDLDLNPNPRWRSNIAYDSGMGFIRSAGYRVRGKPSAWAASCAADLVCRKKKKKKKGF
jgi:uncharacterized protein